MSDIQRYVSDELTHFVGRSKTEEEQYGLLVNKIIKAGWLMHPPHDLNQKSGYEVRFDALISKNELVNPRIICFCDIPVGDLSIHMAKYGRFALSFRKAFLIEKGANPVHYIAKNSTIESLLTAKTKRADFYDQMMGNSLRSLIMLAESLKPKNQDPVTSESAPLAMYLQGISFFLLEEVFSFIKFFDDSKSENDPDNYYMEREWRVMKHVNFGIEDVYRVILPESFVNRFRKDVPDFNGQIMFAE